MRDPAGYGDRNLIAKDTTWMEYSPAERAFVEFDRRWGNSPASLRDHLGVLFRHKRVILAAFLAVMATVYTGLQLRTPVYEARVKLLIRAEKIVESPYYRDLDGSFKTEVTLTESEIVKSTPVLERTVKVLKLNERPLNYEKPFASPLRQSLIDMETQWFKKKRQKHGWKKADRFRWALNNLKNHVKVKPIANTNLLSVTARDFDPAAATAIANTVSRYYVIFDVEQQLAELETKYGEKQLAVKQLRDDIRKFENRVREPSSSYVDTMGPASVKIIEEAPVPTEPVGFPAPVILALAAVCGFFTGVALAFIFDRLDPTLRSSHDVERSLNLSLLGSVPVRKFGPRLLRSEPMLRTRFTRSFEDLADHMHIVMKYAGIRSVLLAASSAGEGTSTVTANLGVYLSRHLGHKVLMIDSNLRHPTLHRLFKVPNRMGFSDVLAGGSAAAATQPLADGMSLMPAGLYAGNPLMLFDPSKIREVLRNMDGAYDVILVDSANMKDFKDVEVLSESVDGVALVIEAGRARQHAVRALLAPFERKKVNILGVVLNRRVFHVPELIYRKV
ncbi:MAG: lipopolysaccharide biosynthesis protein [Candidatus Omnitrophica bacterium]|nr:lipopolysaccharide biosynthesis protein [Candidatus Omnitrophota bacterium]